jgi:Ca2+-binding RTX toxin-like protein
MASNYFVEPLSLPSDRKIEYSVKPFNTNKFLTSKKVSAATSDRTNALFLEDGANSIEIGTFENSPLRGFGNNLSDIPKFSLNGNKAAWDSYEGSGEPVVRYYDGSKTTQLGNGYKPQFYQQGLVWGNKNGVQYFDGNSTKQLIDIAVGGVQGVKVSGDNLAWIGADDQLYLYNGSNTQKVTPNGIFPANIPGFKVEPQFQISGNKVLWQSYNKQPDGTLETDAEIYYFDGNQTQQLTNNIGFDNKPDFYNGNPVWIGSVSPTDNTQQLFTYENGQVKQLSTKNRTLEYQIVDGLLAWDSDGDINIYDGKEVRNLTNSSGSERLELRDGNYAFDRLYWQSTDGKLFGYINGQVQQLNIAGGNALATAASNDNFLFASINDGLLPSNFSQPFRATAAANGQAQQGTANDDNLLGTPNSNILSGLDGDDVLTGSNVRDNLYGGNGNDKIFGRDGSDLIFGEAGNDEIFGEAGDDLLFGGDGNDQIQGGEGADQINGGAGNDRINGGAGNDSIAGGLGIDTIDGGAGNDRLSSANGEIYGGAGDDIINGGRGTTIIRGGAGNDVILGKASESPREGGSAKEELYGDAGNDKITAAQGDDFLNGGDGQDTLDGSFGKDTLVGGNGDDLLNGGFGEDVLTGGAGDDVLTGGSERDQLTGGAGKDTFVFADAGEFLTSRIGFDAIVDFNTTEDKIQLSRILFNLPVGELQANFAAVDQDSNVAGNSAAIVYSKASGNVFYNSNGAEDGLGKGAEFASFTNKPQNLTNSNFVVV